MIQFMMLLRRQKYRNRNQINGFQGLGLATKRYERDLSDNGNVLCLDCGELLPKFVKIHETEHIKRVILLYVN